MILNTVPGKAARNVVAIDLGAESCRVSLLTWKANHGALRLIHRFENRPVARDGHLYWNLRRIREEIEIGLKKCAEAADAPIDSIGIDGWAVDYVRLDAQSKAMDDPYCYRDLRTERCQELLWKSLSAESLYSITGIQMLRFNTVYQLIADQQQKLGGETLWLNLPEYFLHELGGEPVSEFTNATHTQLVDANRRAWSKEVFAAAGLDYKKAPWMVPPGTIVGCVRGALAAIPAFRDTRLIAPACHDTGAAVAGVPGEGDDWAFVSSGTWSLVGTVLDEPCLSPDAFRNNLSNEGGLGGHIRFLKNVNGMWLIEECLRHWNATGASWTIARLIASCRTLPASKEILNVDDGELLLAGEMPARINRVLHRQGLGPYSEDASHAPAMANLIFNSLAARYTEILRMISQVTGKQFRRIYIVGGGSRNSFLNKLVEERSGLQVVCGSVESSTIGNAAIQMSVLDGAMETFGVSANRVADWSRNLAGLGTN